MNYLQFERRWTDDDSMVQLDVIASNGVQVGKQDIYVYPENLTAFGSDLRKFPRSRSDEVGIEYGVEPNYYCYFLLKARVVDNVGHSVLEFRFDNRLAIPQQAKAHFFMQSEPATINELGKSLELWSGNMESPLRFTWK